MNQILYEDSGTKKPANIKNVILFFGIAILIFGLVLTGIGVMHVIQGQETPTTTNKPVIAVEIFETNSIRISISHDKEIEKVVYSWNGGEENVILGRNSKNIDRLVDIPIGENVFYLYVIDSIGVEAEYTNTFRYTSGTDVINPTINLNVIEDAQGKKIRIIAEDETEISYITYRWNDGDEIEIDDVDVSSTIIEYDVEIPTDLQRGENELIVSAVDASNNTATVIKKLKTATRPVIKMPIQNAEYLTITVTDDVGLDRVEYSINGQKYRWTSKVDDRKEWTYVQKLDPGENDIIINAYNKEGVQAKTFHGRCVYTVE